ncbi:hypothetical protein [Salibacterium aidingense]|nr:hypothetical protein [Salibacterium aidingense]
MFIYQLDTSSKLKLLDQQDAEALFSLIKQSEDHLKKWLPWVEFTKQVEDTKTFIASVM